MPSNVEMNVSDLRGMALTCKILVTVNRNVFVFSSSHLLVRLARKFNYHYIYKNSVFKTLAISIILRNCF